jgi:hypothetical protein
MRWMKNFRLSILWGVISIICGWSLITLSILGDIKWKYYLENCNPCIMANYTSFYAILILISIIIVSYGMVQFNKGMICKRKPRS